MFQNDNSNDREQLIEKIRAKGLPASEFDSGGGILHVIVPLLRSSERGLEIHTQDSDLRLGQSHLKYERIAVSEMEARGDGQTIRNKHSQAF